MLKFLHLADVHLDTVFQNRDPELRSFLRKTVMDTFSAGVDLALASGCHAMFIGGDLFDNQTLSFMTEHFLLAEMERLAQGQIQVFYATGNHDPSGTNFRVRQLRWPDNVHIFKNHQPEVYPLKNKEGQVIAYIVGAGHEHQKVGENLARFFPPANQQETVPYIGILHTMITGSIETTEHERYAPCTIQDLKEKGYAYWALGHVHKRAVLAEDPYIVYPGNLMGRNHKECGSKGAYLVEIDDYGQVKLTFHALSPLSWHTLSLSNLEDADSLEQLEQLLAGAVENFLHEEREKEQQVERKIFLRLQLTGICPLYRELTVPENIFTLADKLKEILPVEYLEIEAEGLKPPVCPEKYRQGAHILSELLSLLDSAQTEESLLLQLSPPELAGLPVNVEKKEKIRYLRSLLQDLDYEAVARLVEVDEL